MSKTSTVPDGIVEELQRLGFRWTEDPQYELNRLTGRVQVRDGKNLAPSKEVARYAEAMHYSKFPPILVTEDEILIEGNTRVAAYEVNQIPAAWAIIVNAKKSDPDPVVQARLHALAVALNNQNGRSHSESENREAARLAALAGWQIEDIAKTLKVSSKTAGEIIREVAAETKLSALGVQSNGGLSKKHLRALGSPKILEINNEPYKALTALTRDAGLNVTEIRIIAKEMKDAGSDAAALTLLDSKRAEMSDRIAENDLTGTVRPKPPAMLRRALGFVLKYEDNPAALVEYGPDYKASHLEVLEKSVILLQDVLKAQRNA